MKKGFPLPAPHPFRKKRGILPLRCRGIVYSNSNAIIGKILSLLNGNRAFQKSVFWLCIMGNPAPCWLFAKHGIASYCCVKNKTIKPQHRSGALGGNRLAPER
ncbi:MAG: hypothetical protein E7057_07935 [Lentisphaerae bacterium]|nr:hypothetical protein [Lentisphaerota bacterium]